LHTILFWAKYHQYLWGVSALAYVNKCFGLFITYSFTNSIKGRKRKKSSKPIDEDTDSNDGPADRFRRGEHVPSDYEIASQSDDDDDVRMKVNNFVVQSFVFLVYLRSFRLDCKKSCHSLFTTLLLLTSKQIVSTQLLSKWKVLRWFLSMYNRTI
jgi:hypothetical protein